MEPWRSENIDQLATALAKAQGEIENPRKNKAVTVRTKTGGQYQFEYADLTAIMDAVKAPLSNNGLSYVQLLNQADGGKYQLATRLIHSSGQWIASVTPLIVGEEGNQSFGSGLTFMKRYALASLLGVAAESDDDANAADGNQADVQERNVRAAKPSPIKPAPVTAPVHPETGETSPHKITAKDATTLGSVLIAAVNVAKDAAEVHGWLKENDKGIARLKEAFATTHGLVMSAVQKKLDSFNGEATA